MPLLWVLLMLGSQVNVIFQLLFMPHDIPFNYQENYSELYTYDTE